MDRMTDEELQKLCYNLRHYLSPATQDVAADEIERQAALLKDYRLTFGDIHDVQWNRDDAQTSDDAELGRSFREYNEREVT